MKKTDLVEKIKATRSCMWFPKNQIDLTIDEALNIIAETLASGEEAHIGRIGTFKVVKRKEKKARNPHTGEVVIVPERFAVKFVPGIQLRRMLDLKLNNTNVE